MNKKSIATPPRTAARASSLLAAALLVLCGATLSPFFGEIPRAQAEPGTPESQGYSDVGTQATAGAPTAGAASAGGSGVGGVVACTIPLLAGAIGGSFALAIGGKALQKNPVGQVYVADNGAGMIGAGTTISNNLGLSISISNIIRDDFLNCIARSIARAMLQQITVSTVQWINSGFEGSPSFVQNYDQFFTNVADKAAGQFIQGSDLAFLCSPFRLQVKIAIAQAYAHRGANAYQCSLSRAINNVENFMGGDFSAGGWPGLISFTTSPTNNPYGAFMAAQGGIQSAMANAQTNQRLDLQLSGGFLSIKQQEKCFETATPPPASPNKEIKEITTVSATPNVPMYRVCNIVNVTPGTAVAQALDHTLSINTQSLETAKYFDEIIGALVSRLIQNISSIGLSKLSSGNGYGSSNTDITSSLKQSVLQNITPHQDSARRLINLESQNIASIQASLTRARALANCQANAATSTAPVTDTPTTLDLKKRLAFYQKISTDATASIATLEQYSQRVRATNDISSLQTFVTDFTVGVQNRRFVGDTDVTDAQEDQIKLQSELATIDQNVTTGLQQCNATNPSV